MSTGTFLLLAFGLGAVVGLSNDRTDPRSRKLEELRARAIEAQQISARASQRARDLTAQWMGEQRVLRSNA